MLGTLRRLASLARGNSPRAGDGSKQRAAMRSQIRAGGNSRIDPMGSGSGRASSAAVWDRVISRMNNSN